MYRGGDRGESPPSFVLGGFVPFLAGVERGWAFSVPKNTHRNPPNENNSLPSYHPDLFDLLRSGKQLRWCCKAGDLGNAHGKTPGAKEVMWAGSPSAKVCQRLFAFPMRYWFSVLFCIGLSSVYLFSPCIWRAVCLEVCIPVSLECTC